MIVSGFSRHLRDAIVINSQRQAVYAELSAGKSLTVSMHLIRSEVLALPLAYYFDLRSRPFIRRGIGVVRNDFVSMAELPDATRPPRFHGAMGRLHLSTLRARLEVYQQLCLAALSASDLVAICRASAELLGFIEQLQQLQQVHVAMTHHLISSLAYAAQNGLTYARQSQGQSLGLSRQLIWLQLRVLPQGLKLDRRAQAVHQLNCGIIVNDLPDIPFDRECLG